MVKLRTVVAEDEPFAREFLVGILNEIAEIEVVKACRNGRLARDAIYEYQPDLVVLDVHMPLMDGFEVVKSIQADEMPLIIFVTAYDQYAIQAFEAHAIDYVLKPIDRERVRGAINRALEWHSNRHAGDEVKRLVLGAVEQVLTSGELPQMVMAAKDSNPTESVVGDRAPQIEVRQRGVTLKIRHSDIEWVDAAGDNMCIHAGGKTYVKRGTLRELLTHLDPARFKRVHRSTIVNLDSVHQVIPRDKGAFYLLLKSGERVKVSRSHNDVVREFLEP